MPPPSEGPMRVTLIFHIWDSLFSLQLIPDRYTWGGSCRKRGEFRYALKSFKNVINMIHACFLEYDKTITVQDVEVLLEKRIVKHAKKRAGNKKLRRSSARKQSTNPRKPPSTPGGLENIKTTAQSKEESMNDDLDGEHHQIKNDGNHIEEDKSQARDDRKKETRGKEVATADSETNDSDDSDDSHYMAEEFLEDDYEEAGEEEEGKADDDGGGAVGDDEEEVGNLLLIKKRRKKSNGQKNAKKQKN